MSFNVKKILEDVELSMELTLDTGDSKDCTVKWDGTYDGLQYEIHSFVRMHYLDGILHCSIE